MVAKVTGGKSTFLKNQTIPFKKLPAEEIIHDTQLSVITNPIDPKRISKEPTSCLNASSIVKAGVSIFRHSRSILFC